MKIVTDCAADLPADEAQLLDVTVAPLYISFPEGETDSSSLSPDRFYDKLEAMQPNIPTTSQPSAGLFAQIYGGENDPEILSVHISSGLSGTANSARLGAGQVQGKAVHVVDSMTLSGGQRFQVLAAARLAKAGCSSAKIMEHLGKIRQSTEVAFTLDTLSYLARGGRIGRVQAIAGSLLHLKPIIHVDKRDGKYSSAGRARTIARAMEEIADHLVKLYGSEQQMWISVMHGRMPVQAEALGRLLESKLRVGKLEVMRISPVLGVHTGPGVVGAAAVPMDLMTTGAL